MNHKVKTINGVQNFKTRNTNKEPWDDALPVPKPPGILSVLTVAFIAIVCFANSLDGHFVFDDSEAIVNNEDIRPEKSVWNLFFNDFWGTRLTSNLSHKSYRPLTVLSFRWNYWLSGGLFPWGYHLSNILLHALVSVLAHTVFASLLGDRCPRAAFLAAILFAVHPVHVEAVSGVVGRADLLCALFFFLSFLAYRSSLAQADRLAQMWLLGTSMVLAGLAMFSKEQGITVIGVCSIYDIIVHSKIHPSNIVNMMWQGILKLFHHRTRRKPGSSEDEAKSQCHSDSSGGWGKGQSQQVHWLLFRDLALRHGVLMTAGAILLLLRWRIMGSSPPVFQKVDNPASFADSFLTRVMTYNYLYTINAWLLLCPEWLCFDWSMGCVPLVNPQFPVDPRIGAAVAFWVSLLFIFRACLVHPCSRTRRSLTMGLALVVIPFLPAMNIFFHVGFVLAERVLYLPSAGFCLIVVVGLRQLAVAISHHRVVMSDLCYQRNMHQGWKATKNGVHKQDTFPSCAVVPKVLQAAFMTVVLIFVARTVWRSHEWRTEATLFRSALRVCPLNAKVHYNIAKDAGDSGNKTFALAEYQEALRLNPDYDQAMNNLANLLKDDGKLVEAEVLLRKAVKLRPSFAAAWMNLGIVLAGLKRYPEAEISYLTAIRHRKKYPDCYYNLGNLYLDQKKYDDAYLAWRNATRLKPKHSLAWSNLIIMLDNIGQSSRAVSVAHEALLALPSEASLHFNLANTLGKAGRFADAEKHFVAAITFDRTNAVYYTNLGVLYHRWKKYKKAEELYRRALEIVPRLQSARENLAMLQRTLRKAGHQTQ